MISIDVETDGPTPMKNNLLSIGLCGITNIGEEKFAVKYNIKSLEGHIADEQTMKFWSGFPDMWKAINTDPEDYKDVFLKISDELKILAKNYKIIFSAGPACFDWMFFKCYYELANNGTFYDIGFQCYCQSTTWNLLKKIKKISPEKSNAFKELFTKDGLHDPLSDARNQAKFYNFILDFF